MSEMTGRLWGVLILFLLVQVMFVYFANDSILLGKDTKDDVEKHTSDNNNNNNNNNNILSPKKQNTDDEYALAAHESFGFFSDIPESDWKLKQQIAAATPHHLSGRHDKTSGFFYQPRGWYQNNWEPDFSCSFERFLGPIRDGHKWVCDPHRLKDQADCLVYSMGSNGNFDFESAVHNVAPNCEIHVFDPGAYGSKMKQWMGKDAKNTYYHSYGLKPSYKTDPFLTLNKRMPSGNFKTFADILQELGHAGRTVSIFKADIEGGEWTSFRDWLNADVLLQQILVETHDAPPIANTFFAELHKAGYAMFHKEPNIQFAGGDCMEFGFVKLRPSFFQGDAHHPVDHSEEALEHAKKYNAEYKTNKAKETYDYGREMRLTGVI